jgi:hypothetical protein
MFVRPHLSGKKLGMVVCDCHPNDEGKLKTGVLLSRLAWAKSKTLPPK